MEKSEKNTYSLSMYAHRSDILGLRWSDERRACKAFKIKVLWAFLGACGSILVPKFYAAWKNQDIDRQK